MGLLAIGGGGGGGGSTVDLSVDPGGTEAMKKIEDAEKRQLFRDEDVRAGAGDKVGCLLRASVILKLF